ESGEDMRGDRSTPGRCALRAKQVKQTDFVAQMLKARRKSLGGPATKSFPPSRPSLFYGRRCTGWSGACAGGTSHEPFHYPDLGIAGYGLARCHAAGSKPGGQDTTRDTQHPPRAARKGPGLADQEPGPKRLVGQ